MYAAVRVYSDNTGLADSLVEREQDVRETIAGIAGFRGYYLVRTDDGAASISLYDSREGAEESSRAAGGWVKENLPEHVKSPPQVTVGEVVVDSSSW